MSADNGELAGDLFSRIAQVFEEMEIPPRPSNQDTLETIFGHIKRLPVQNVPLYRRHVLQIAAPLAALAAVVVVAIALWQSPGSIAFGQVIEQVKKAASVTFTITLKRPGVREISGQAYAKSPDLLRCDFKSGDHTVVNITNYTKGELISFDPISSVATAWKCSGQATCNDIVRQLREMKGDRVKRVEEPVPQADPNIEVFETNENDIPGKVWIDKQTKLPIKVEMGDPETALGQTVFSNFDWNASVAGSLFEVPANFKIAKNDLLAQPTEDELIAALRLRQAFSAEPYAANFLANEPGLTIGRLAYNHSISRIANTERKLKVLGPILPLIGISEAEAQDPMIVGERIDYLCMKIDQWAIVITRRGAWVGSGVRPGEEKPLCWWRDAGATNVRVLYGNLTIRESAEIPSSR